MRSLKIQLGVQKTSVLVYKWTHDKSEIYPSQASKLSVPDSVVAVRRLTRRGAGESPKKGMERVVSINK